jgi:hypothetical protein
MAMRRKNGASGGRKPTPKSARHPSATGKAAGKKDAGTKKAPGRKIGKKKATRKKKKATSKKRATGKKKANSKKATGKKKIPGTEKGLKENPTRVAHEETRERVVPVVVVTRVKQPLSDTWPTEEEWRQSGLCAEAQADGIPCTALGRHCEICERAGQKDSS